MQKVGTQTLVQNSIIKIEYDNCDHKKDPFFLENTANFIDLRRPLTSSMVSRKPSNISMVLKRPLPSMVFQWFLVLLPSLSMVFDGFGPLVKRCDGFDGSLWSTAQPAQPWMNLQPFSSC